jgi:orotidine-5'-phosphate decarboxylase
MVSRRGAGLQPRKSRTPRRTRKASLDSRLAATIGCALTYFERLRTLSRERHTLVCVGLDPDPERIPGGAAGALRHCREVVRQTEEHACCFKPNSAFWEQYGPDGWKALLELREEAPNTPFLFDAKRGDMGNTMRAYAVAAFATLGMDAATVNPYLGADSLEEFTSYKDRGVYVLCRSSNPGAKDLQHLDAKGKPLYLHVAKLAESVNANSNVGLVVGATAPEQIAELRGATDLPFLIPGVGAQGGDLEGSVRAAWNGDPASCLISSSRSVLYAESPARAAAALKGEINAVVGARA